MTPLTVLTLVIMISYGKVNLNIRHLKSMIDRLPFSLCDGNVHRCVFPRPHLRWKLHPSEVLPAYPVQSLRKTNESRGGVSKRIQTFARSKCECAGLCSASEDREDRRTACHFFSWEKDNETCELGHMDLGWRFNYTDDQDEHLKRVSVDTGG